MIALADLFTLKRRSNGAPAVFPTSKDNFPPFSISRFKTNVCVVFSFNLEDDAVKLRDVTNVVFFVVVVVRRVEVNCLAKIFNPKKFYSGLISSLARYF
jgi:hypothetical protein